jgi:hypothetical protein
MSEQSPKPGTGLASVPLPIWIIAGLLALIALGRANERPVEPAANVAVEPLGAPLDRPVEVSAEQLAKAFGENEVAAMQAYGGVTVAVTGVVDGITLDFADDPVVRLRAGRYSNFNASFDKERGAATGLLREGETVTIFCSNVREFVGSPSLSDCAIVPQP